MSFLKELANDFLGGGQQSQQQPPQVPPPWSVRWDNSENRWLYINEETGQRTHDMPNWSGMRNDWNNEENKIQGDFDRDERRAEDFPDNAARWAGRKTQEVENVPQDFEQGAERRYNNAVQDVEDAPENVAGFMGRRVGDAERFGDRVEGGFGNMVQDVENIPGNIASGFERRWDNTEQKFDNAEQDVERFDQGIENSYDAGRNEGRNDDW